jgi:hypothetical protein
MRSPTAIGWILSASAAAGLLLTAALAGEPVWLPVLALIVGLALAVATVVGCIDWIITRWLGWVADYRRATAVSERVALLERIARMDEQQLEFAKRYVPRIEMASGDAGPALFLRVVNDTIPMDFVRELLAEGDAEFLCPVRRYGEGSVERKWAEEFTTWCIWMGYAAEAGGNRPARWIAYERALRALGL